MKDIRQKLLATFQVEHRDHVEQIRSLVAMIGQTGVQPAAPQLEEVFRRAHSLKGAARAVDLREIEKLAHGMETLFSRVRQGTLALDRTALGAVTQVLDACEDYAAALGENRPLAESGALQAIENLLGIESAPAEKSKPAAIPVFEPADTVRVLVRNFDGMLQSTGGLVLESVRQHQIAAQLGAVARLASGLELKAGKTGLGSAAQTLARQTRSLRLIHQRSVWRLARLGKQLQRDVEQARLAPAETLLEGCRKTVRDLARDQAKEIEFRGSSAPVQADRRILQALKDPILHLLRNAASHGIEPPGVRTAHGKPAAGVIALRIDSEGSRLKVTVEDDGCGVDLARISEVAVEQGHLSQAEADRFSPEAMSRMVFRPGFSTARAVTDISGRGMGLSVVYEAARRLQGEVDIKPGERGGTSIRMSVPLAMSTHRLLLVSCGEQRFGLPMYAIERLDRVAARDIETVESRPGIRVRDRHVPLYSLAQFLGLAEPKRADTFLVAVLASGARRAAIAVSAFHSEIEAIIQDLGPLSPASSKISGGILLDDGSIALVLNPLELTGAAAPQPIEQAEPEPPPKPQSSSFILVVDDSITTRTLEKSILEAHGYNVAVATDGLEALARIRASMPDLVITDIQMPRMDGFGLLASIRADQRLSRIPVIIVSSLERREDQERGLALGADGYIVKHRFDQGELLAAIRQIL